MAAGLGEQGDVVAGGLVAVVAAEVEDAAVAQALDLRVGQVLPGGHHGGGGQIERPAVGIVGDEQEVVHDGGVMMSRLAS